jgi:hypothetical protein
LHEPRAPAGTAAQLVVQTYWHATGRTWQLRVQAGQSGDAAERDALLDLLLLEEQLQHTAQRLLSTVWDIRLGKPTTTVAS